MLQPTERITRVLEKYDAKGVFFIDLLSLIACEGKSELKEDLVLVKNQIIDLYTKGHFVFPHIHPHWLDAVYMKEENQFDLSDISKYSMANLDNTVVKSLFEKCRIYLEDLGISYSVWGYRAGGWCIQPFALFVDIFRENHIKYEFSVLPGFVNDCSFQHFDYSNVTQTNPYYFSNNIEIGQNDGEFTAFPISTTIVPSRYRLPDRLFKKYMWMSSDRGFGDGLSAQTSGLRPIDRNREMISIDTLNLAKYFWYKRFLRENSYMHWISHPKMFTRHGLSVFDRFLKYANSEYKLNFDIRLMKTN